MSPFIRSVMGLLMLLTPQVLSAGETAPHKTTATDPLTPMQRRLDQGMLRLDFHPRWGYLPSLLRALHIPVSSQTLVFSKTSSQFRLISPRSPRALYFNDDVYVGWVPGGAFLEISAAAPGGSAVFFTLEQKETQNPRLIPDDGQCLQCHESSRTLRVPGHLTRSVYPGPSGLPFFETGTINVDHSTPLAKRFGGWYVTGTLEGATHRGNATIPSPERTQTLDAGPGSAVTDLKGRFNLDNYLSPHSDIVAHLVLAHQTQMHNHIAKAATETRQALAYLKENTRVFGEASERTRALVRRRIERPGEKLLRHLLFVDEAPLGGRVRGTTSFAEDFQRQRIRDRRGRSLWDLDLRTRILRYPCSYLIYSDAFRSLPAPVKRYVYARLLEVLRGHDQTAEFAHLPEADRKAIREILLDTLPEARRYWGRRMP